MAVGVQRLDRASVTETRPANQATTAPYADDILVRDRGERGLGDRSGYIVERFFSGEQFAQILDRFCCSEESG
jgi:hypothetical protein